MFGAWRGSGTTRLGAGFVSAAAGVLTTGAFVGGFVATGALGTDALVPCALVTGEWLTVAAGVALTGGFAAIGTPAGAAVTTGRTGCPAPGAAALGGAAGCNSCCFFSRIALAASPGL